MLLSGPLLSGRLTPNPYVEILDYYFFFFSALWSSFVRPFRIDFWKPPVFLGIMSCPRYARYVSAYVILFGLRIFFVWFGLWIDLY
jgi:hypothetical protein